ncbi:signal recognition particle receptor ftsy [Plakobranchus ocellatus]|uniref:Signal recognition particle receptor ftsy n=1 Tax=Plakobranchus ocellatus TaxID=259542 RepID=A0AAV4A0J8_9GAST|nr:signal recognition particle receptor ftsy [Plakobranchus ocellatus]
MLIEVSANQLSIGTVQNLQHIEKQVDDIQKQHDGAEDDHVCGQRVFLPAHQHLGVQDDVLQARCDSELVSKARSDSELASKARCDSELVSMARFDSELVSKARCDSELVSMARYDFDLVSMARCDAELVSMARSDSELVSMARLTLNSCIYGWL